MPTEGSTAQEDESIAFSNKKPFHVFLWAQSSAVLCSESKSLNRYWLRLQQSLIFADAVELDLSARHPFEADINKAPKAHEKNFWL